MDVKFKYVIFSINNQANPFCVSDMKALFVSLSYPVPVHCIGMYKGTVENSWMTTVDAYKAISAVPGFFISELEGQESILFVSECNKQYAELYYLLDGRREELGCMHCVSAEEARKHDAWTYRHDTQKFYIAKKANPDRVPPPAGWLTSVERAQRQQDLVDLDTACRVLRINNYGPVAERLEDMRADYAEWYGLNQC